MGRDPFEATAKGPGGERTKGARPGAGQRSCGPVWCARRAQSAVVSVVSPEGHVAGPYVQWCSLVGVELVCDESCVCTGARWVSEQEPRGMARDVYEPLCEVVTAVQARVEGLVPEGLSDWTIWARAFVAGVCSASAAWRAAEAARHEAVLYTGDPRLRYVVLAAEDVAWAVAHAAAGNRALGLQRSAATLQLLRKSLPS